MKKQKYNTGGDILGGISSLTPLLNFIVPGLGTAVGPVAGMGAKALNNNESNNINPTAYTNTKSFGYETGGEINPINNSSFKVVGNPQQTDGNVLNYKGKNIKLDYNEVVDTQKDRVFSDKYINPLTGKKISEESLTLEKSKKQLENKKVDSLTANTKKFLDLQSDALFNIQETVAMLNGDREVNAEGYALGGNIRNNFGPGDPSVPPSIWQTLLQNQGMVDGMNEYPMGQIGTPKTIKPIQGTGNLYPTYLNELPQNTNTNNSINLGFNLGDPSQNAINSFLSNPKQRIDKNYMDVNPKQSLSETLSTDNLLPETSGKNGANSFLSQLSLGDKIQGGVALASMIPKAIEAFSKVQKEPYRTVNTPITLQQMDPRNALFNSQNQYNAQLSDLNNQVSSNSTRNALSANAYAQKLQADNNIISNYENQNKSLVTQFQDRLAQRQQYNNQSMMQTDDLNSRNRGAREQMRMGFYGDIAGAGQFLGTALNQQKKEKIQFDALKSLTPDVLSNFLKNNPEFSKYLQTK